MTGREDDYGGVEADSDDDGELENHNNDWSSFHGGRRRSIQTFRVKGGKWKPNALLDNDESLEDHAAGEITNTSTETEPELEPEPEGELQPGQCTPPKDEDSMPSCGDDTQPASLSSSERRYVVEAVSFIVEENWGNADFTCLYRVRVHGDAA